jgi:hypothetical protein
MEIFCGSCWDVGLGANPGSVPLGVGKLVEPEGWLARSRASVSEAKRNNSRGPLTEFHEGAARTGWRGNGRVKLLGDVAS